MTTSPKVGGMHLARDKILEQCLLDANDLASRHLSPRASQPPDMKNTCLCQSASRCTHFIPAHPCCTASNVLNWWSCVALDWYLQLTCLLLCACNDAARTWMSESCAGLFSFHTASCGIKNLYILQLTPPSSSMNLATTIHTTSPFGVCLSKDAPGWVVQIAQVCFLEIIYHWDSTLRICCFMLYIGVPFEHVGGGVLFKFHFDFKLVCCAGAAALMTFKTATILMNPKSWTIRAHSFRNKQAETKTQPDPNPTDGGVPNRPGKEFLRTLLLLSPKRFKLGRGRFSQANQQGKGAEVPQHDLLIGGWAFCLRSCTTLCFWPTAGLKGLEPSNGSVLYNKQRARWGSSFGNKAPYTTQYIQFTSKKGKWVKRGDGMVDSSDWRPQFQHSPSTIAFPKCKCKRRARCQVGHQTKRGWQNKMRPRKTSSCTINKMSKSCGNCQANHAQQ